jgi:murein hydrolase activator
MRKYLLFYLNFCLLFFFFVPLYSQSRTDLERQKERTRHEIEEKQRALDKTHEKQNVTVKRLQLINATIELRKSLINQISAEVQAIDVQISETYKDISLLSKEIDSLKREYSSLIRIEYLNKGRSERLMFILSASSFNQAYRRAFYFRNIDSAIKAKAVQIESSSKLLIQKAEELKKIKHDKDLSLKERANEKKILQKEQDQQQNLMFELQKTEGSLRKEIQNKKLIEKKLEAEIRKLIDEEIRKRKKSNNVKANKIDEALSSNFRDNRGKLPWPLEGVSVISSFGEHEHPLLKGVKVNNNGIDISSLKSPKVKVVFSGEVSKIIRIPGTNITVIIRHGNYITVYQNLEQVLVKTGEKVTTGQAIGTAGRSDTGAFLLHFEIWNEINKQNPQTWLK